MTTIKTFTAVALTTLTMATAFAPTQAQAAGGRNAAIAAGILGGIAAGALIANGGIRPAYAAPVYASDCVRRHVGYNVYGDPIFRTVCY